MTDNDLPQDNASPSAGTPRPVPSRDRKTTLGTWLWPVIILLVVIAGVAYIISHNAPAASPRSARGGKPTVGDYVATKGDLPVYLNALGTVTPAATVVVHTQISGILQSVAFTEGQMVTKGQFLAQIDARPYEAALKQAQGSLARDQAQLSAARVELTRYRTLLAQDSLAQQTVDTQAALVAQLEGTVLSDQAAIDTQKLSLTYAHVVAPLSGRVGLRQVDAGNYVTPGDANGLVAITQQTPIDVSFALPEDQVPNVTRRFNAKQALPVTVLDRDQSNTLATGQLYSLDNLIDTTTGTLRAKARFANADGNLFPSQFVNVRLLIDTLHDTVIIPSSAILRGSNGLFVYVIDPRGAVHVRTVKTGPSDGERTAILSGLEVGERVVTEGTDRLREGACVALAGAKVRTSTSDTASSHGGKAAQPGFFANLLSGGAGKTGQNAKPAKGVASDCGGGSSPYAGSGSGSLPPHGNKAGGASRLKAQLAQLNLSPEQTAKAEAILAAAGQKAQSADDPDSRHAAYASATEQINALLTPDQQAQLKAARADASGSEAHNRP